VKVLFLTTSFPRFPGDYAGIFVFHLARHLGKAGIEVVVVAPNDGFQKSFEIRDGIAIHRFRFFLDKKQTFLAGGGGLPEHLKKDKRLTLLMPLFLAAFLRKAISEARDADVIHCLWFPLGLLGLITGRIRNKPFLVNIRGSDKLFFKAPFLLFSKMIIRRSRAVIAVSRDLLKNLPAGPKFGIIPNGVDVGGRRQVVGDIPPNAVLYVGNLSRNKSVETLLRAAALEGGEDFAILIVGDGPERRALTEFVEAHGLGRRVRFLNALSQDEIFFLMERCVMLVLPSLSEGRSNVLLEALASGLPVIASSIPENREIIRDGRTGLLFEPLHAEDLRDKIVRLLKEAELRKSLSEEGKRFIRDAGLTWEKTARAYAEIYEKILSPEKK
jgi:glycosyltransferase involved in cell wall biosynthesis